jgi:hypothetical protein
MKPAEVLKFHDTIPFWKFDGHLFPGLYDPQIADKRLARAPIPADSPLSMGAEP